MASRTKLLLATGSLFSSAILVVVSAIWYLNFLHNQQHLQHIAELQQASRYVNTMRYASLERAMIVNQMLVTEDIFERDDQFLRFRALASDFITARDKLLDIPMLPPEVTQAWKSVSSDVNRAGTSQNRLINLLYESPEGIRDRRVYKMVVQETIPAQQAFMNGLANLQEVQWEYVEQAAYQTLDENERTSKFSLVLTAIAILLLLFISLYVFRRITLFQNNLIMARDEAMVANQHKSLFLTKVSHELRTPLNAILGFAQLIDMRNRETLKDEDTEENIGQILHAGYHLRDLIEEILDLARIEAGRISLKKEKIELADLTKSVLDLLRTNIDKKSITLNLDGLGHQQVYADPVRLKQVLLNLLSNAVKYNRDHGEIIVTAEEEENCMVKVSITDTGEGIKKENIHELFRMFNRLEAANKGIEGSGVGLVVTRSLVNAMGGEIGVESEYGKGSTFWIRLVCSCCDIHENK